MIQPSVKLSVVIPARNEFPQIVFTVHSILNAWETSGEDPQDIEIIIVDNCSTDSDPEKPGVKGTSTYLMPRGMYSNRVLRVLYAPLAGNHAVRNLGAQMARGKYVFFSDAHMTYAPGYFRHMLDTVQRLGGIVHSPIGWHGAYPLKPGRGLGYQYSIKLGEEIKGTWNNQLVDKDEAFYIPALGHCSLIVNREEFLNFRGYPTVHRCYGGGEFYVNMKWWMFGSTVAVEPKAYAWHLASGRGYSYNHDDYKINVLGIAWALGMDDWRERAYINWLRTGRKDVMERLYRVSADEHEQDRQFVKKHRQTTFNEMIVKRPWDEKNMEILGKKNSGLLVFHDTWLPLLSESPAAKQAYEDSIYQADLEKFINENLSEFVYQRVAK